MDVRRFVLPTIGTGVTPTRALTMALAFRHFPALKNETCLWNPSGPPLGPAPWERCCLNVEIDY